MADIELSEDEIQHLIESEGDLRSNGPTDANGTRFPIEDDGQAPY